MIGSILITLALVASVFTIIMYYLTNKGYSNTLNLARVGYHTMALSIIAASALLMNAILTHQYQYYYVFNYSNGDLPTGLLMSTFYAGQEGSFMLWLLLTAIVGVILQGYTSKRGDLEYRVMMVFTLAAAFLLVMVSPGLKNPFAFIWANPTFVETTKINPSFLSLSFLQNFMFTDPGNNKTLIQMNSEVAGLLASNNISVSDFVIQGKGLNPLLQNFWMQIHPPMLFVGFAMSTVPFAFAFASLMKNDYKDWVKQSFPWLLASTAVLGLAIMLGGYWAYGVLGWGGYWGWDPVENSSLVPWIIGVAAVHTMLIQLKTQSAGSAGRYVKTNLILSIMTYVLVLYSTFLTRSGILGDASVHSFVDPGMTVYLLLIMFIGTFTLLGFGAIAYRWKYLEKTFQGEDNMLSRELALFTGAVALIASAIIIIAGTSAPIFGRSVELNFYNELNLPIAIIMGVLNGLSLLLKWRQTDGKNLWEKSRNSVIATAVLSLVIIFGGGITELMAIIFTFSSVFTLVVNSEIAYRVFKTKKQNLGAYVAHAGIAFFMLGVIATGGFTSEQQVVLVKDQPKNVLGYDLTFKGYNTFDNGQKYAFDIEVAGDGNSSIIAPVMFVAEFNNSLMREPDIWSRMTKDFYISPISYDEKNNHDHGSGSETNVTISKNETYDYNGMKITFNKFNFPPDAMAAMQSGEEFFIGAEIKVEGKGKSFDVEPKMISSGGKKTFEPAEINDLNLRLQMTDLDASGTVKLTLSEIEVTDTKENKVVTAQPTLTIDASIKPFIGLVWLGTLVMTLGFVVSVIRRTKEARV